MKGVRVEGVILKTECVLKFYFIFLEARNVSVWQSKDWSIGTDQEPYHAPIMVILCCEAVKST